MVFCFRFGWVSHQNKSIEQIVVVYVVNRLVRDKRLFSSHKKLEFLSKAKIWSANH